MPHYLYQVAYTPQAWATQIKNPADRIEAVRPVIEKLGGKVVCGYLAFGEYDIIAIAEMPNNTAAAGFAIDAAAGGAVKAIKTTPLMTTREGIQALKAAAKAPYQPPSARTKVSRGSPARSTRRARSK